MAAVPAADAGPAPAPAGMVGPNAVIQLGAALGDMLGPGRAEALFAAEGFGALLHDPPGAMIDQAIPAALMARLWRDLPAATARAVAAEAGRRTADYVIANRIPAVAQWLLRHAPRQLGARLLMTAILKNAWTFCGSGRCTVETGRRLAITVADNPLAVPGCAWHVAVFERLFARLVAEGTAVRHTSCCRDGGPCRFEIALPGR